MSAWPAIKTAQALVVEGIVPCSEDKLKALAKAYGIGRKLGRAYVFTPADVENLIEKLPCPSSSSQVATVDATSTYAGPSGDAALTKALERVTAGRRKTSSSSGRRNSSSSRSTVIALSEHSRKPR
jgi:hypothetical protein